VNFCGRLIFFNLSKLILIFYTPLSENSPVIPPRTICNFTGSRCYQHFSEGVKIVSKYTSNPPEITIELMLKCFNCSAIFSNIFVSGTVLDIPSFTPPLFSQPMTLVHKSSVTFVRKTTWELVLILINTE